MTRTQKLTTLAVLFVTSGILSACYFPNMDMKRQVLNRLAVPNGMFERQIKADPYVIPSFEKVHEAGGIATIYIEGGQMIWDEFIKEREVATPLNPLGLHISTRDSSKNVIWLARPCQFNYSPKIDGTPCTREEYGPGRFSLTNLRAMNAAIDNIQKKYHFKGINLVGIQDGAGVAVHIAASRNDVISLRTIAGMLDTEVFNQVYIPENYETVVDRTSNNPGMHAAHLAQLPQHHFVGEWDKIVGPEMAQNFRHAAGNSSCIRVSEIKGVTNEKGWVNRWPDLLKSPVDCKAGMITPSH